MITITLPDGTEKQFDQPFITAHDVALSIGEGLARAAVGAKVDGELVDLHRPIKSDATVALITKPRKGTPINEQDTDALHLLRHSCAHVMAEAIQRIWPDTLLAYGPPLDNGFYYDIYLETPISSDEFSKIEAEMKKIIKEKRPFIRYELEPNDGFKKLRAKGNKYKLDNADRAIRGGATKLSWYVTGFPYKEKSLSNDTEYYHFRVKEKDDNGKLVTFVRTVHADRIQGNLIPAYHREDMPSEEYSAMSNALWEDHWEDLCQGPHVPNTSAIGAFKVMSVASSNWHGDVTLDRFQRLYGTAFYDKKDLATYLEQLEEAKLRDHRVIGQKLDLFTIDEQVGQGLILWKPNGAMVRTVLQDFLQKELIRRGYDMVYTPHIGKIDLYKTSGHYPYYSESQFPPIKMRDSDEEYLLRPMNCPHHIKIYDSSPHSYRELPIRLAEFGTVYRFEQSGQLTGMTRVRGFTQDDAHIFCTPDQVKKEFRDTIELVQFVFDTFGFEDVSIRLSLRDPDSDKYAGDAADWDRAEQELREVLQEMEINYTEDIGEAAFYGPKVDFVVRDVIGRSWQLGTVQLDYNLPQRFKLEYIGADNKTHQPVMIHRAPFGSMERFMAILIEHYAGAFPLWLAPKQIVVLPVSDKFADYAQGIYDKLKAADLRVTIDNTSERVNNKIRIAQEQKVPYMLVVGGRDVEAGTVSVRCRSRADLGALTLDEFTEQVKREIETRGQEQVTVS